MSELSGELRGRRAIFCFHGEMGLSKVPMPMAGVEHMLPGLQGSTRRFPVEIELVKTMLDGHQRRKHKQLPSDGQSAN